MRVWASVVSRGHPKSAPSERLQLKRLVGKITLDDRIHNPIPLQEPTDADIISKRFVQLTPEQADPALAEAQKDPVPFERKRRHSYSYCRTATSRPRRRSIEHSRNVHVRKKGHRKKYAREKAASIKNYHTEKHDRKRSAHRTAPQRAPEPKRPNAKASRRDSTHGPQPPVGKSIRSTKRGGESPRRVRLTRPPHKQSSREEKQPHYRSQTHPQTHVQKRDAEVSPSDTSEVAQKPQTSARCLSQQPRLMGPHQKHPQDPSQKLSPEEAIQKTPHAESQRVRKSAKDTRQEIDVALETPHPRTLQSPEATDQLTQGTLERAGGQTAHANREAGLSTTLSNPLTNPQQQKQSSQEVPPQAGLGDTSNQITPSSERSVAEPAHILLRKKTEKEAAQNMPAGATLRGKSCGPMEMSFPIPFYERIHWSDSDETSDGHQPSEGENNKPDSTQRSEEKQNDHPAAPILQRSPSAPETLQPSLSPTPSPRQVTTPVYRASAFQEQAAMIHPPSPVVMKGGPPSSTLRGIHGEPLPAKASPMENKPRCEWQPPEPPPFRRWEILQCGLQRFAPQKVPMHVPNFWSRWRCRNYRILFSQMCLRSTNQFPRIPRRY